jgi:midasin (ATPase involved in ribosome maturation)
MAAKASAEVIDLKPDPSPALTKAVQSAMGMSATNDPSLSGLVITKSVRELERLIRPAVPINVFISGDTGLGKSTAVMYIAKKLGIPCIRVSISFQTDVDDLIGGIRLEKDGDTTVTTFVKGPVLRAMEMENCILLLDEVDTANPRVLMELQAILELRGYLIKKTGEMVYPAKGFRVIATGNTKGLGDMSGRFIATNPLNEAFRDRFHTYIDFIPPDEKEMLEILAMGAADLEEEVRQCLASWYWTIVDSRNKGVHTTIISPRRMVKIAELFLLFETKNVDDFLQVKEVLLYGLRFFEDKTRDAFLNVWENAISTSAQARRAARQRKQSEAAAAPGGGPTAGTQGAPKAVPAGAAGAARFANLSVDEFGEALPY